MPYEYGLTEPKTERMNLPQRDGDPSAWRDYQQEVRHKTARTSKSTGQLQRDWLVA